MWRLLGAIARTWDRERLLSILLDGKSRLIGVDEVSVGSLTATLVHPREVAKSLILGNAASFIVVHNHPSGDPEPSGEDRALTKRLKAVGELIGIPLLDHVVLGFETYRSLSESGDL